MTGIQQPAEVQMNNCTCQRTWISRQRFRNSLVSSCSTFSSSNTSGTSLSRVVSASSSSTNTVRRISKARRGVMRLSPSTVRSDPSHDLEAFVAVPPSKPCVRMSCHTCRSCPNADRVSKMSGVVASSSENASKVSKSASRSCVHSTRMSCTTLARTQSR